MSLRNEYEALLEFSESKMVLKVIRMMNKIHMWGSILVYVSCLMSTKDSSVRIAEKREQGREENAYMELEMRTRQKNKKKH